MPSLTAAERETVILFDDSSDTATITTWQRSVITKLERNPAATKVEEWRYGTSVGARFTLPAKLVSFRTTVRKGGPGNPDALLKHRQAKQGR